MSEFKEKTVIVTGGNAGIGKATCIEFARAGANIVVSARRQEEGEKTVAELKELGAKAIFARCDIAKFDDVQQLIATTIKEFGGFHYAVNNAGYGGISKKIADYPEDVWDQVININLKGTWYCMKEQIPHLVEAGGGAIVNVSSIGGLVGFPLIGPYTAAKHGIVGLGKTAALEYAKKGIRINTVCPAGTDTEMLQGLFKASGDEAKARKGLESSIPMQRLSPPKEVANLILWLCSKKSAYITGQAIPIDGGWTAR